MNIARTWLREMNACYSDEEIAELVPEGGLTIQEVLDLPIPALDRVWVATRPGVLTRVQLVAFAQGCAERARGYAPSAAYAAAAAAATAATYAADAYCAYSAATEREAQITHLRQLIGSGGGGLHS